MLAHLNSMYDWCFRLQHTFDSKSSTSSSSKMKQNRIILPLFQVDEEVAHEMKILKKPGPCRVKEEFSRIWWFSPDWRGDQKPGPFRVKHDIAAWIEEEDDGPLSAAKSDPTYGPLLTALVQGGFQCGLWMVPHLFQPKVSQIYGEDGHLWSKDDRNVSQSGP